MNVHEAISEACRTVRRRYRESEEPPYANVEDVRTDEEVAWAINNGYCEHFQASVCDLLEERLSAKQYESIQYINDNDLCVDNPDQFKPRQLRPEIWPGTTPGYLPQGYMHVWIAYEGRHYDAACPEGVDHPLQLSVNRSALQREVKGAFVPNPPELSELIEPVEQRARKLERGNKEPRWISS